MSKTKAVAITGMGIALYVAVSAIIKIPLISHIQTDLGYIVFGAFCVWFGYSAVIVGVAGCIIESVLFNGMFPPGWAVGQLFIGLACVFAYKRLENKRQAARYIIGTIITVISVFIGIAVIKSVIECFMYSIPFEVKIPKGIIAAAADCVPMVIGMGVGYTFSNYIDQRIKRN